MTLERIKKLRESGKKIIEIFEKLSIGKINSNVDMFGTGYVFLTIKNSRKKILEIGNVIINKKVPSLFYIRIFDKKYRKQIIDFLNSKKNDFEKILKRDVEFVPYNKIDFKEKNEKVHRLQYSVSDWKKSLFFCRNTSVSVVYVCTRRVSEKLVGA